MMVGIDQPGEYEKPTQIKNLIGSGWKFGRRPNLLNKAVASEYSAVRDFPAPAVHGH
jgi:hypothetical protein